MLVVYDVQFNRPKLLIMSIYSVWDPQKSIYAKQTESYIEDLHLAAAVEE